MTNSRSSDTSSWSRVAEKKRAESRFVPHDYQMQAMKFMVSRPAAGLFLDPGFGKTSITLHVFETLRQRNLVDALFVFAKLRIVQNTWPDEIAKWNLPTDWTLLHGTKKDARLRERHHAYFINYEGLPWLARQPMSKIFAGRRIMAVFDESTKLKDTQTQRFKILRRMLPLFPRRHILTGSPVPQSLMDIFGQVFVLDLGETFSPYITHFRNAYFYPTGYQGYDWALRDGAEQEIYDKISPLVLRLPRDLLKMPILTVTPVPVVLPPEARKVYDDVEKDFVADLEEGSITAANAAVAAGKLRQIAGGMVYDERGQTHHVHDEKLDALVELVEELNGQSALVIYEYVHELERIKAVFPDAVHIGAGVTDKQARKHIEDFNAGRVRLLLGHPQSIAHGLNLQASASTVIFYTLPWSLENYEQSIRRIWRQGQMKNVVAYQLIARGTVDEVVAETLKEKDTTQRALLRALEKHYETRKAGGAEGPAAREDHHGIRSDGDRHEGMADRARQSAQHHAKGAARRVRK